MNEYELKKKNQPKSGCAKPIIGFAIALFLCMMFLTSLEDSSSSRSTNINTSNSRLNNSRIDRDAVVSLVDRAMRLEGYETTSSFAGTLFVVTTQDVSEAGIDDLNRRMSVAGGIVGALYSVFRDTPRDELAATEPRTIVINFNIGEVRMLRLSFPFTDAVRYMEEDLTLQQFIARWQIE